MLKRIISEISSNVDDGEKLASFSLDTTTNSHNPLRENHSLAALHGIRSDLPLDSQQSARRRRERAGVVRQDATVVTLNRHAP